MSDQKPRNVVNKALRTRAGNANVAISVDGRVRIEPKTGLYKRKGREGTRAAVAKAERGDE